MKNAFLNLLSRAGADFWGSGAKNGGPQHVFTQKKISQQRRVSCAFISGATPLCWSSRAYFRPLARDNGLTGSVFDVSLISARPPPPHPRHQKYEYETEKWRREGRSRFLSARHWRLEGEVGGGGGKRGGRGDEPRTAPPPPQSEVSITFPGHSYRTFCMTNDKEQTTSGKSPNTVQKCL